jgi:hypothetical protein
MFLPTPKIDSRLIRFASEEAHGGDKTVKIEEKVARD